MTNKHIVQFHPSVLVAECKERFLMSVYGKGYPQQAYRCKPNTPGGNPSVIDGGRDSGPLATLERELEEEFGPNYPEELQFGYTEVWAPKEDIRLIHDSMTQEIEPRMDYFVNVKSLGEKMNVAGTGIFSVFYGHIDEDAFDCAEYNINTMRRINTEGYAGIFSIDSLRKAAGRDSQKISCAHLTPIILNNLFYSTTEIPHPENIEVVNTGKIRTSYESYLGDSDLTYEDSWLKH